MTDVLDSPTAPSLAATASGAAEPRYQLRRMVLVNVGTNTHQPSNRVTSIDPRGGAAVLGENGVGKTTTLRILPLFFGHLPSQIVAGGQGQEAMIGFVLPLDTSAIVFEYQRGSDIEDDLRTVVLRRQADDPNQAFYRLYRCGFRKELFVYEGRFTDDAEAQALAMQQGIPMTRKLSTAEYRSVILRVPATSKDRDALRRWGLDYSFGPKSLDNLDRLVAAMVKKHINFGDIVQVAVNLVQQEIGIGSERSRLELKQGKAPIDRWLRNRKACADAFKLEPKVKELEGKVQEHAKSEARLRNLRSDVDTLSGLRQEEGAQLTAEINGLTDQRESTVRTLEEERTRLRESASTCSREAATAAALYETESANATHFDTERAAHWEGRVRGLPKLREDQRLVNEQLSAAQSAQADAVARYGKLAQDARDAASAQALNLEKGKQVHRDRLTATLQGIGEAEAEAASRARTDSEAKRDELTATLEPMLGRLGELKARMSEPKASDEAIRHQEEAFERLDAHRTLVTNAQREADAKGGLRSKERQAFEAHERDIRLARTDLDAAQAAHAKALRDLAPNPDSLLAKLREHGDEHWKRDFAKVVNPALLHREDLSPAFTSEGSDAYGWRLDTRAIQAPDWTDDALARQAVEQTAAREAACRLRLETLQEALTARGRDLKAAEDAATASAAHAAVITGQLGALRDAHEAAKQRVASEKRDGASVAKAEHDKVSREAEDIRIQVRNLAARLESELNHIKTSHDAQRAAARQEQAAAVDAVDAQIRQSQSDLEAKLKSINAQLQEHLTSAGVDVKRLDTLRKSAGLLADEVRTVEDKQVLVERWKAWLADGGAPRAEQLKAAAQRAAATSRASAEKLSAFNVRSAQELHVLDSALDAKSKHLTRIQDDIRTLSELETVFDSYRAAGASVITRDASATELKGKVRNEKSALDNLLLDITRRTRNLRSELTEKDTAVRDLVEASMEEVAKEASDLARADQLCRCYRLIGSQIAPDVNLTLRTLLTNIGAFQKAIAGFETQVKRFNSRLQAGLSEVHRFERVKDLRLDLITNFENLGFYKKLSRMTDVARELNSDPTRDPTRGLPSEEVARALADFSSVLSSDGNVEVNLSSHITLQGSVMDNGQRKTFKRASELENVSSEGLTSLVLITLMTALLNTIRGSEPVHVPWVTDEVGKFDPKNFLALMTMLRDNHIDVVTASPELGPTQQAMFAHRYMFQDRGRIREYQRRSAVDAVVEIEQ